MIVSDWRGYATVLCLAMFGCSKQQTYGKPVLIGYETPLEGNWYRDPSVVEQRCADQSDPIHGYKLHLDLDGDNIADTTLCPCDLTTKGNHNGTNEAK